MYIIKGDAQNTLLQEKKKKNSQLFYNLFELVYLGREVSWKGSESC